RKLDGEAHRQGTEADRAEGWRRGRGDGTRRRCGRQHRAVRRERRPALSPRRAAACAWFGLWRCHGRARAPRGEGAMKPEPKPGILDIAHYVPGRAKAEGVAQPLKLSANENPLGCSEAAAAAYRAAANEIHLYPDANT